MDDRALADMDSMTDAYPQIDQNLHIISRTFSIPIKFLDQPLQKQVGTAYALNRLIDTIEDTVKDNTLRNAYLLECKGILEGENPAMILAISKNRAFDVKKEQDKRTLKLAPAIVESYASLPSDIKGIIKKESCIMIDGMMEHEDIITFDDQNRYCYHVAGCVGEMLTELFDKSTGFTETQKEILNANAINYGIALQKINIIKDVKEDIIRGECYWPKEILEGNSLTQDSLLEPAQRDRAQKVLGIMLDNAKPYFGNALAYLTNLPMRRDIRIFCAIPLLLATKTYQTIRDRSYMTASASDVFEKNVKISAEDVHEIVGFSKSHWDRNDCIKDMYCGHLMTIEAENER